MSSVKLYRYCSSKSLWTLGFYVEDATPVFAYKHLVRVVLFSQLQPFIHFRVHELQMICIKCGVSTLLTWQRKVLAPVKAGSRDIYQNIPEVREERPEVALVVRPPVWINSHHVLVERHAQPEWRLLSAIDLNGKVARRFLILGEQLWSLSMTV